MKNALHTLAEGYTVRIPFSLILAVSLFFGVASDAGAKAIKQKGFASPEEAVTAFVNGIKANDNEAVWAMRGCLLTNG